MFASYKPDHIAASDIFYNNGNSSRIPIIIILQELLDLVCVSAVDVTSKLNIMQN